MYGLLLLWRRSARVRRGSGTSLSVAADLMGPRGSFTPHTSSLRPGRSETPTCHTLKERCVDPLLGGGRSEFMSSPRTQESFKGEIIHTSKFTNAKNNAGKRVVIIGAGSSAHDVAMDHVENDVVEVVRYHLFH